MHPLRSTEVSLQFAAPWSPWWLLLALPLAVGLGLWLYRRQTREVVRWQAVGLIALRGLLLAGLVFIIFRPSLLWRTILTYPGRIVLLLDDSGSMGVHDTGLTPTEALRLARARPGTPSAAPVNDLARPLAAVVEQLRDFERQSQALDRRSDAFWAAAEQRAQAVTASFDAFAKQARTITGLPAAERQQVDELVALLPEWRSGAQAFFTGNHAPAAAAYAAYRRKLQDAQERLYQLQAAGDQRDLQAAQHPDHAAVDSMRAEPRISLVRHAVNGLFTAIAPRLPPHQEVLVQRLLADTTTPLSTFKPSDLQVAPGTTDLLTPITRLLQEDNPFPLTGIVVVSDGRQLAAGNGAAVARLAAQQQVPIHTAAVGATREPWDLAILDVVAPPFAVKGATTNVRVRLKTVLPAPADVRVELLLRGQPVAGDTFKLGAAAEQTCVLPLTPAETGRWRYTVRVASVPDEVEPLANNTRDVVINVRDEHFRVLLLDWQPRWETRFALNILQRLDYLDLNAIIVVTQPDATLARGVRKGTWPKDRATLALYDLIVIGDLPPDLLTSDEWAALRDTVTTGGKTLCVLAGPGPSPVADPALAALLPLTDPLPAATPPATPAAAEPERVRLCLTGAGRWHPLTAALGTALPVVPDPSLSGWRPGSRALALAAPAGPPLLSTRYAGLGQVLLVGDEQLWKHLNPTQLPAHTALYVNLVSWAIDADRLPAAPAAPAVPLLDRHVLSARDGVQVWLPGGAPGTAIEAVDGTQVIAQQLLARAAAGSNLASATFTHLHLPARAITFRVQGATAATAPLLVVDDNPELGWLSRDDAFLNTLAEGSGGRAAQLSELPSLLPDFAPKERVEKQEHLWRLWDARWVFAFLLSILTLEWIWRKWVGLV